MAVNQHLVPVCTKTSQSVVTAVVETERRVKEVSLATAVVAMGIVAPRTITACSRMDARLLLGAARELVREAGQFCWEEVCCAVVLEDEMRLTVTLINEMNGLMSTQSSSIGKHKIAIDEIHNHI